MIEIGLSLSDLWPVIPTIIVWELARPLIKGFWNKWKDVTDEE